VDHAFGAWVLAVAGKSATVSPRPGPASGRGPAGVDGHRV